MSWPRTPPAREQLLNRKTLRGRPFHLVRWQGHASAAGSWEPARGPDSERLARHCPQHWQSRCARSLSTVTRRRLPGAPLARRLGSGSAGAGGSSEAVAVTGPPVADSAGPPAGVGFAATGGASPAGLAVGLDRGAEVAAAGSPALGYRDAIRGPLNRGIGL